MAVSAEKLETIRGIGLVSTRREDGLPIYPPFPYPILRNATVALMREIFMGGMAQQLLDTLKEYERNGVFVHPKSAAFLLVLVDVYERYAPRPQLRRSSASDSDQEDRDEVQDDSQDEDPGEEYHKFATELGHRYAVKPRYFLNAAD